MTTIPAPYPYFTDASGNALEAGKIYIGTAGLDPRTNPIAVYQDEALTIAWAQPIRTVGGYPVYIGAPSNIFTSAATFSVIVTTLTGSVVFRDLNANGNDPSLRSDLASTTPGKGIDLIGFARKRLRTNVNYYVRTDGNDSNTGLANTAGSAFLTIQKAFDTIAETLDLDGYVATVNVADGTYTAPISLYGLATGAGDDQPVRLIGNETTPANVVVSTATNALTMQYGAYLLVAGVTFQTTGSGIGWNVQSNSMLEHRNCRFGNVANEMILTQHHATVRALGTLTVAGNAQYFCHATKRSIIDFAARTVAFSGTPTFSTYLYGVNDASINLDSATITGAGAGAILVHKNGTMNTSSLNGSYLGGVAPVVNDGGYIFAQSLYEARTLYVRTDGNDNNDGLVNTAARAFLTIGAAVNFLAKLPPNALYFSTAQDSGFLIQVANGTYAETVNLRDVNTVGATIRGDEVTPANVIVAGVSDGFVALGLSSKWFIRGVTISAAAGSCIRAEQGSQVTFRNVRFGAASGPHVSTQTGARAIADGNYAITAAAPWHKFARTSSVILTSDRTVTLTGSPAFSQSYAYADDVSLIRCVGMTFSGSATGKRYDVVTNGVINTNGGGASYLPGSVAGTTATGGQYV